MSQKTNMDQLVAGISRTEGEKPVDTGAVAAAEATSTVLPPKRAASQAERERKKAETNRSLAAGREAKAPPVPKAPALVGNSDAKTPPASTVGVTAFPAPAVPAASAEPGPAVHAGGTTAARPNQEGTPEGRHMPEALDPDRKAIEGMNGATGAAQVTLPVPVVPVSNTEQGAPTQADEAPVAPPGEEHRLHAGDRARAYRERANTVKSRSTTYMKNTKTVADALKTRRTRQRAMQKESFQLEMMADGAEVQDALTERVRALGFTLPRLPKLLMEAERSETTYDEVIEWLKSRPASSARLPSSA